MAQRRSLKQVRKYMSQEEKPMHLDFTVTEFEQFTLVEFYIPGGVLEPEDLGTVAAPSIPGSKGVIISGRGPIWLYGYLVHRYHATAWVGCYDPRSGGAVVVERHDVMAPPIGGVVPVPES